MTASPQVRLANDIAAQFHHLPPDRAAAAVAEHITAFWDPRMRRALRALVEQSTGSGPGPRPGPGTGEDPGQEAGQEAEQEGLDPIAIAAARLLPG
jgi:formate dehydrogenase subunit delta